MLWLGQSSTFIKKQHGRKSYEVKIQLQYYNGLDYLGYTTQLETVKAGTHAGKEVDKFM